MRYLRIYLHMKETEAGVGHPAKDRVALARAFVAKATLNLPTTEALIDRLKVDQPLRRLCGFSRDIGFRASIASRGPKPRLPTSDWLSVAMNF